MTGVASRPVRRLSTMPDVAPALRLGVGSPAGLHSAVWTVTLARDTDQTISIAPERACPAISHTSCHGGWQVRVPVDTAEEHRLLGLSPAPELGQQLGPPAAGWHVGLILLIPTFVLTPTAHPIGAAVTRLPAPEPGRCTQITVLLGESNTADLDVTAPLEAGSLVAQRAGLQLWKGQTALPPDMTRHLMRTRQQLVDIASPRPRQLPAFTCFRTAGGVDVVADVGPI